MDSWNPFKINWNPAASPSCPLCCSHSNPGAPQVPQKWQHQACQITRGARAFPPESNTKKIAKRATLRACTDMILNVTNSFWVLLLLLQQSAASYTRGFRQCLEALEKIANDKIDRKQYFEILSTSMFTECKQIDGQTEASRNFENSKTRSWFVYGNDINIKVWMTYRSFWKRCPTL